MDPSNCRYTKEHEWIRRDDDGFYVGITAYAAEQLGDVTYVELPVVGTVVTQGKECATVESVKAASDIYAPAGGVVDAINDALADAPELVNQSPYEKGWFFKLGQVDASQYEGLMDAAAYDTYVQGLDH